MTAMKHIVFLFITCLLSASIHAQRITQTYNNVSLSDALRQLSEQKTGFNIFFLYNELEDFRITTTVKNKTLPDAIQQMIGFYPIRVIVDTDNPKEKNIFVECTHKTENHLTGTIINEQGKPVAYANIAILNPIDSTLITGGVSNESGYFAIPCETRQTLARISYVGYKTIYKKYDGWNMGTIQLEPESFTINGVTVKGERNIVTIENGHLIYNIPQLIHLIPADDAYEALTRIPGVMDTGSGLSFAGQSVTLIINGKPTTLNEEQVVERLKQMPASMVAKAEVMAAAPAKYHVHGMAINIVTKDFVGTNQFSSQLQSYYRQGKYGYGSAKGTMLYQRGKLGIDASYTYGYGNAYGKVEHIAHHPLGNQRIDYYDRCDRMSSNINHHYRIGMDFAFSEECRVNVAYTGAWSSTNAVNSSKGLENSVQKSKLHTYLHNIDASLSVPFGIQLGISYTNYQNPRTQHLDGKLYDETRNLYAESQQRISKWLFTADQKHKLGKGWELNYGLEAQLTNNESYQTTCTADGKQLPDATSHVDYEERILDFYVGFSKQITSSFSLEASLGAEQYNAPKWNEWRVYPTLNATYNIDKENLLNLSFTSKTAYPTYWSTMSSIFYTSAYSEIWGNPELKPQPTYDINLIWQHRQRYTFTAFAYFIPDYFVQLAYQPTDRMAVIMKETNFNFSHICGLQGSARFNMGQWLNGTAMLTGTYHHDKSDHFFDLPFDRRKLTAILSGTVSAKLSTKHQLLLILNPSIQTKAIQGVYDIDSYFRMNASLRWSSDNKKWSVIVAGNNITNSHADTHSRLGNQDYTLHIWMQSPIVTLTTIYRIGSFKEKKTKVVDTSRMGY